MTDDSEGRDVGCQFKSDKRSSSEAGGLGTGWSTLVRSLSHIRGLISDVSRVFTDEGWLRSEACRNRPVVISLAKCMTGRGTKDNALFTMNNIEPLNSRKGGILLGGGARNLEENSSFDI